MSDVKALLVFCEGSHDVAFVQKVLILCLEFQKMKWKFSEYPSPLNALFKQTVQDHAAGDLSLDMAHKFFLPDSVLQKSDHLILLFNSGGSSQTVIVKSLLKQFVYFLESPNEGAPNSQIFSDATQSVVKEAKYLFIYDADHNGTTALFEKIKKDFEVIDEETKWSFNELKVSKDNLFGAIADDKAAYIWAENTDFGTLEDILLPMVENDQKEIVEKASNFIDDPLFKWETNSTDTQREIAQISKRKKAIITSVGQRNNSGFSLSVIIKNETKKIIKDDVFLQNSSVISFADFINKFMRTIQKTIGVCGGHARIRNTRIPVWTIISLQQQGADNPELLRNFPSLTIDDLSTVRFYYNTHQEEIDRAIAFSINTM